MQRGFPRGFLLIKIRRALDCLVVLKVVEVRQVEEREVGMDRLSVEALAPLPLLTPLPQRDEVLFVGPVVVFLLLFFLSLTDLFCRGRRCAQGRLRRIP